MCLASACQKLLMRCRVSGLCIGLHLGRGLDRRDPCQCERKHSRFNRRHGFTFDSPSRTVEFKRRLKGASDQHQKGRMCLGMSMTVIAMHHLVLPRARLMVNDTCQTWTSVAANIDTELTRSGCFPSRYAARIRLFPSIPMRPL